MTKKFIIPALALAALLSASAMVCSAPDGRSAKSAPVARQVSPSSLCLASAIADREVEEGSADEEAVSVFGFANGGAGCWQAGAGMDELIEELLKSGDLTEDGAQRLREALPHGLPLGIPGAHALRFAPVQGHAYSFGDGSKSGKVFHWKGKGEDGTAKSLEISIDDNGEIKVEGQGYSEQELDRIREEIRVQKENGQDVFDIPGFGQVFHWQGEGVAPHAFVLPEGRAGAWFDKDGGFDSGKWEEQFGDSFELFMAPSPLAPGAHGFNFYTEDGQLREDVERMVREILEEMGIEHGGGQAAPAPAAFSVENC